ncbi:tRNA1(Val) (adenine(37)-N6)-methyltransferase [Hoeflea sp.]|uniref:tRNA1(Val) (adenine(37)-N6)-methyltransferase n=1 Tax=Hoeflea sp. TaxID=1940281 RepID=UPI003B52BE6F
MKSGADRPLEASGNSPVSPGAPPGYSIDAFHRGRFYVLQPETEGHRAGLDAMLLAATVPAEAKGSLADLGAGAGAAGLAVASRIEGIEVVLVERAPRMAECARQTIGHPLNARFANRIRVIEADVTLRGEARCATGLADRAFDHVIMNPPFNSVRDRTTPDALKAEAHAMDSSNLFEEWLRTANAILKPAGQVSLIARPESLAEILAALGRRFGGIEITPVCPRANDDAIRVLVTAVKGSRARLLLRDRIVIHAGAGRNFSPMANDLANGRANWPRRARQSAQNAPK